MAAFSGTAGSVTIHTSGTALVSGVSEWSFDLSQTPPETTVFGELADTYVPSTRTATGSFSGNADWAIAGQSTLASLFLSNFNGGTIVFRLYENNRYWSGTAMLTGISESLSVKGKAETSFNFQSTNIVLMV